MGRTGDRRAVPVILKKLELLTATSEFSHHRAVGLALELLGDSAAAKPLARLLGLPGMSGYVHDTIAESVRRQDGQAADLVTAAETCPARCIHPGKPLDPNEPGLEELIARAEPFN